MAKKKTADRADDDARTAAQEEFASLMEKGQTAVLDGYQQWLELFRELPTPSIPSGDALNVMSEEAVDGFFDFSASVIENQRVLTKKLLELTSRN